MGGSTRTKTTSANATSPKSLNSSLSDNVIETLTNNSTRLKAVCSELAGVIEDQVTNPNKQTGGEDNEILSQRLLEWTADLFAIASDIDFYVSPPPENE